MLIQLTHDTTRPLKHGSLVSSSTISSLTTLQVKEESAHGVLWFVIREPHQWIEEVWNGNKHQCCRPGFSSLKRRGCCHFAKIIHYTVYSLVVSACTHTCRSEYSSSTNSSTCRGSVHLYKYICTTTTGLEFHEGQDHGLCCPGLGLGAHPIDLMKFQACYCYMYESSVHIKK